MSFSPQLIWFLVGLGLILLEFGAPGAILVFFGLGAWIVALTTWADLTTSLAWQILIFAVSSVALLLLLRRRLRGQFLGHTDDKQDLKHDLEEFIGHTVQVTEAIEPGRSGRIEFKGAGWEAHSEHSLRPGDQAEITQMDGIQVTVRRVDDPNHPASSQEALS